MDNPEKNSNIGYTRHRPKINVGENRRGNQEWTIQRNWQYWVHTSLAGDKQNQKHNTICVRHHFSQTNTNRFA